jgi:DNA primase
MIDVLATLERLGIEGKESGDEYVARCPMHAARTGREDSHPSWSINLQTGLFLCFSCGYR